MKLGGLLPVAAAVGIVTLAVMGPTVRVERSLGADPAPVTANQEKREQRGSQTVTRGRLAGLTAQYLRARLREAVPSDPAFTVLADAVIQFQCLADGRRAPPARAGPPDPV